jgi:hypothetical protein
LLFASATLELQESQSKQNLPHTTQPAPLPIVSATAGSAMENDKHSTKNLMPNEYLLILIENNCGEIFKS